MYKQILVPVDGSQTALAALRHAVGLARAFQAELFVVHVIDIYPFLGVGTDTAVGQAEYLSAANANAEGALRAALAIVEAAGVPCESATVEGHAAEEGILQAAGTCDADLIVMGSHGRRGISRLILGSQASKVLAHSAIPVLVVK